ncbi:putative inactive dehydrogenase EasA [Leucoagaricus sp. SymC.cos]|nr:putative inactive dehydrogenase EasA [Leucoagaricus sp. SymC.cos]
MTASTSHLFQLIFIGQVNLKHRVVLAPLTRVRADNNHVPSLPVMKEYYTQRASTPGTLIITEATSVAQKAGGMSNHPGIYNQEQVDAWRQIVDSVHATGSFIFSQLWGLGRQANEAQLKAEDPSFPVVGPSPIPEAEDATIPRELTTPEIKEYIQLFATAARRAVHEANFDGVEIHAANGYLIDQFLQDVSNQRQDEYGGSVERRSRFGLEIVKAVIEAVGTAQKVGVRLSPWNSFAGMGMDDPVPQFSHFVSTLKREFPDLAYIHVVEPRVSGDRDNKTPLQGRQATNDFLRDIWFSRPFISAGGYDRQEAIRQANARENELIAFGKIFLANIVHAVHGNKSYIFCQLWALGRQANQESLVEDDFGHGVVAPSSIPARRITGEIGPVPRELTITEIHEFIHLYALAAHHAIHEVGFDGVEIHGACGYLIDQFLRDKTNYRTDEYGGTVENRSRFGLEVVAAVVEAVGEEEKVSIRLSPWDTFGDMGMDDPVPQYTHFVRELKMKFPRLSYIHVLEPRVHGSEDVQAKEHESNDFIRDIWAPGVVVSAGGFIRQRAIEQSSIWPNELVAFGRLFTSNPDLPLRLMRNVPLTPYDRSTFYLAGDSSGRGYTDFQFAPISQSSNEAMLNSS